MHHLRQGLILESLLGWLAVDTHLLRIDQADSYISIKHQ